MRTNPPHRVAADAVLAFGAALAEVAAGRSMMNVACDR
jgi:hypothetical protein